VQGWAQVAACWEEVKGSYAFSVEDSVRIPKISSSALENLRRSFRQRLGRSIEHGERGGRHGTVHATRNPVGKPGAVTMRCDERRSAGQGGKAGVGWGAEQGLPRQPSPKKLHP